MERSATGAEVTDRAILQMCVTWTWSSYMANRISRKDGCTYEQALERIADMKRRGLLRFDRQQLGTSSIEVTVVRAYLP